MQSSVAQSNPGYGRAHGQGMAYFQGQPLVYQPPFSDTVVRGGVGPGGTRLRPSSTP